MKRLVLFTLLMMLMSLSAFSHDIKVANSDGVTIYYNYINNGTELAVTYQGSDYYDYSNEYQGNVVIPEEVTYMNRTRKVTSIGDFAFLGCTGLTSIEIPNSVTSIGIEVFSSCSGLTSIKIPDGVTSIGSSAFNGCSGLTSIEIPNSVTSIGGGAFSGYSLMSFTVHNNRPPVADSDITTQDVYDSCVLYIPEGSENTYYASTYWNKFKNIKTIGAIEKVPQDVNGDGIVDTQDVLEIYKYIQEH